MSIIRNLPNAITCGNIICGVIGIVFAMKGALDWAFWMMLAAAVFDFLDGLAARLLKAYSDIGKELDSLCDVVSFGVLPSVMLVQLLSSVDAFGRVGSAIFASIPILLAVFSALRLAKFNTDERQHESFLGLPTPAAAILCGSIAAYVTEAPGSWIDELCSGEVFIPLLVVVICALLVSEIPMFSLKFATGKDAPKREKMKRNIFIIFLILSFFFVYWVNQPLSAFFSLVFAGYIVENLIFALIPDKR